MKRVLSIVFAVLLPVVGIANAAQEQWLWWGATNPIPVTAADPLPVTVSGGLTVMKTDASNATLPDARTNLAVPHLSPASPGGGVAAFSILPPIKVVNAAAGPADSAVGVASLWARSQSPAARINFYTRFKSRVIDIGDWGACLAVDQVKTKFICNDTLVPATYQDGEWHNFIFAWNTTTGVLQIAVDGALLVTGPNTSAGGAFTIPMNVALDASFGVAGYPFDASAAVINGYGNAAQVDLAEFYVDLANTLDLSVAANIAKFYLAGAPVALGATCATPTGAQPVTCLKGPAPTGATFTNAGSGGNFTIGGGGNGLVVPAVATPVRNRTADPPQDLLLYWDSSDVKEGGNATIQSPIYPQTNAFVYLSSSGTGDLNTFTITLPNCSNLLNTLTGINGTKVAITADMNVGTLIVNSQSGVVTNPPTKIVAGKAFGFICSTHADNLTKGWLPMGMNGNLQVDPADAPAGNMVINGFFDIDQQNNGVETTIGGGVRAVDKWLGVTPGGPTLNLTTKQSTTSPPAGYRQYLHIAANTGVTLSAAQAIGIRNVIEGTYWNGAAYGTASAKPLSCGGWARSNTIGTYPFALVNASANRSYVTTWSIIAANGWEHKTITIPGDTTGTWATGPNQIGGVIHFNFGAGANFQTTVNTWGAGLFYDVSATTKLSTVTGATMDLEAWHCNFGSALLDENPLPFAMELTRAQRYLETSIPLGTAIGQNKGAAGAVTFQTPYAQATLATTTTYVPFQVPKFMNTGNAPTMTFYSTTVASANCYNATRAADAGAGAAVNTSDHGFGLQCTMAAGDALGDVLRVHFKADSLF